MSQAVRHLKTYSYNPTESEKSRTRFKIPRLQTGPQALGNPI